MQLNFEVLEMQKLNMTMDAAQIDGKNGVICLFIVFTSRVMVIKMSKIAHFMHFFLITSSKTITVWTHYLSLSEKFYLALLENAIDYYSLSYH